MTYIADLSPCTYFREADALNLRAVAWLSDDRPVPIGPVQESVIARLEQLLETAYSPWGFFGSHECDLCAVARLDALSQTKKLAGFPDTRTKFTPPILRYRSKGLRNLIVPGEKEVYVCPELILHYVVDHGYCPPEPFCHAVLRCPSIPSIPYFHRLLGVGGEAWVTFIEKNAQIGLACPEFMPQDVQDEARIAMSAVRLWRAE